MSKGAPHVTMGDGGKGKLPATFRLDPNVYKALRVLALLDDRSINDAANEALRRYVNGRRADLDRPLSESIGFL